MTMLTAKARRMRAMTHSLYGTALTTVLIGVLEAKSDRVYEMYEWVDIRSILQQLHLRGDGITVHGEEEQASVGGNCAHVALVKGGGILAARDLIELGVLP